MTKPSRRWGAKPPSQSQHRHERWTKTRCENSKGKKTSRTRGRRVVRAPRLRLDHLFSTCIFVMYTFLSFLKRLLCWFSSACLYIVTLSHFHVVCVCFRLVKRLLQFDRSVAKATGASHIFQSHLRMWIYLSAQAQVPPPLFYSLRFVAVAVASKYVFHHLRFRFWKSRCIRFVLILVRFLQVLC